MRAIDLLSRSWGNLILVVMMLGCSQDFPSQSIENVGRGNILRVAYEREVDLLNPFTSQQLVDVQFSMMEGLVTTDENQNYVPVLAKEVPTEENGLIVVNADGTVDMTWELQERVSWHDGEPFTSADVCFTWEFVRDPGSRTYNRDWYLGIIECSTPDALTVVFKWDRIYAYYAGLFEVILPKHVLGNMTADEIVNYEPFNRGSQTIGTGPFRFAEWKSGEYIRVVRNENYWRGSEVPAIDEIVWSFIPDINTRLNALKSGRYDFGRIRPTQVAEIQALSGLNVNLVSVNSVMHFDVSVSTPHGKVLFSDPRVRKALFHAIDREAIADKFMAGTVIIANSPLNPTSPYHRSGVYSYGDGPDRSRALLDEAGWRVGEDGIREKGGERLSFVMLNRGGSTDRIGIAEVIQAQLKGVGVEVTFQTLESAAWTQRWRSGEWEGMVTAWWLPADPSITGLYACDGPNNMTKFCNQELDELMLRSDRLLDLEQRKAALGEAQELLAKLGVTLPLFHNVVPEVISTRVKGYRGSGTNFGSFWNLHAWNLEG